MVKNNLLFALMAAVCFCFSSISTAEILVLRSIEDGFISSGMPDMPTTVFAGPFLSVGNYLSDITSTYLKFDLSQIPDGQEIVSASLGATGNNVTPEAPMIGAYSLVDDSWTRETITWNNAPTIMSWGASDIQQADTGDVVWSVGSGVSLAYGDDGVYSVVLKLSQAFVSGQFATFWSSEMSSGDYTPTLTIEYQPVPEPATMMLFGLGGLALRRRKA